MKIKIKKMTDNVYIKTIYKTITRIDLGVSTAAISYYGLLSLFPAIIFLAAILPLLGLTTDVIMNFLDSGMPKSIAGVISPMIESILKHPGVGTLSFSVVVALWSLSRVIAMIRQSQNEIYDVKVNSNSFLGRAISVAWLILLLGIMAVLFLVFSIGSNILDALPINAQLTHQLNYLKSATIPVGMFFGLCLFNFLIPAKKPRFIFVVIGTVVQLLGMLLLAKGFGFYVKIAGRSYSFYQAIGSVVILMIWLNLVATIALIGTMVTAILEQLWPHKNDRFNKVNQILDLSEHKNKEK
ncbi:YihY/virulence factor BrkB family protein [Weissella koreensis]|uniref:YihY/virulence factor BrkB family protein n=2 Tax=Weissella koreensis TaxID=165096 RepID=UPI00026F3668|nr:YihY/virulence factor BrkB family protein [Weissella koreensis]AVH75291.1 YihY/virulence factor BrkB family protein [Weissella koreensis]EJF33325.1 hypothetical protein JC2156_10760 [Weissella koreensis KCTC 3621]QGN20515.1 YihY family inner membrane protein [Weissella koreensis]